MTPESGPTKSISSPAPAGAYSRAFVTVLGSLMVVMPCIQGYFAIQPWLALAEFLPAEVILEQITSVATIWNSTVIAGLLMVIGGICLIVRQPRLGWILGWPAMAFALFSTLETLLLLGVSIVKEPSSLQFLLATGLEFLEMTYFMPVILFAVQLLGTVYLLRRRIRTQFALSRRHFWIALGILLFLFIDLHIILATYYFQNQ
jgi:hypothetical protein